jgi:transposase
VPAVQSFPAGRDFAAWLELTPLPKSIGVKQKLGAVLKRGERTIRRLLILGASAMAHQASRRGAPKGLRLAQMLPNLPPEEAAAKDGAPVAWIEIATMPIEPPRRS